MIKYTIRSMLLNFIKADFKEDLLVKKYLELISCGAKTSEILVLVQNSNLKKQFSDKVLNQINVDAIEKLQIHSFFSLVYNTLVDNWCFIENSIPSEKAFILPNLVGLEVSQILLKDILKENEVKYEVDKYLVRGLDYYTGIIYEFDITLSDGKTLTIGGGGRYSSLVKELDGPDLNCVGFGIGVNRLVLVLADLYGLDSFKANLNDENSAFKNDMHPKS